MRGSSSWSDRTVPADEEEQQTQEQAEQLQKPDEE